MSGNKFYKGRTNNHLTWVMVDATDFATPESALSAATKIKIYGKLRSAAGVNFVSSGTGSLTNDIVHVGASALGLYSIGLVKADLSDASAAWYDQYIISLSATGAAYQTLIVDGGIADSYLSDVLSDLQSDFQSRVPKAVATNSQLSDLHSDLRSYLVVMSGIQSDIMSMLTAQSDAVSNVYSAVLLTQSLASDAHSAAVIAQSINASDMSDIRSAITLAGTPASIASKVWSDYESRLGTTVSDANSKVVLAQSRISDIQSYLVLMSDMVSNAYSAAVVAGSINASDMSDIRSAINGLTVSISASDISDIASATAAAVGFTPTQIASKVWSDYESRIGGTVSDANSRAVLAQSRVSDIQSYLVAMSGMLSDTYSAAVLAQSINASDMSDLRSAITAGGGTATISASDISDIASAVKASLSSDLSDIYSAAVVAQSISASDMSDLRSAITAGGAASITASDISDIASAVKAAIASDLSDIYSVAAQAASSASDVYSVLTTARAEPGQGAPGATLAALEKLDYLYKAWRNKKTQTSTQFSLFADNTTTVDQKTTTGDDGTTATVGEMVSGP